MLTNFHLTAICYHKGNISLFHVPLHQELQDSLAEQWGEQVEAFFSEIDEISFNAGYQPEAHERFCLDGYKLPHWLENQTTLTINTHSPIADVGDVASNIKGLVAFACNENNNEVILFQNFTRGRIIRPGGIIFLDRETFRSTESTALSLDNHLSAVYLPEREKLLFRNFRTVNSFLPLADYFEDASEQEIRDVLSHACLIADNTQQILSFSDQWFRKRFAMLRQSEVLEKYSVEQIQKHSRQYQIDIQIRENKIVFPSSKSEAKRLLQFLNEEIFRGAITETLYETNSKREAS